MKVEKQWTTEAGLPAAVRIVGWANYHRCGYVGVPEGHPFYGLDYHQPSLLIKPEWIEEQPVGKRNAVSLFTAGVGALPGELVARRLELLLDVHGSLTFSGERDDLPDNYWWFGFDCSHPRDDTFTDPDARVPSGPNARSLEYVVEECERLAEQLQHWAKKVEESRAQEQADAARV